MGQPCCSRGCCMPVASVLHASGFWMEGLEPVRSSALPLPSPAHPAQACCASATAAWWALRGWTGLGRPTACWRKRLTSGCGSTRDCCWKAQRQRQPGPTSAAEARPAAAGRMIAAAAARRGTSGSSPARCAGGGTRTSTYAPCMPAGQETAAAARARSDTLDV